MISHFLCHFLNCSHSLHSSIACGVKSNSVLSFWKCPEELVNTFAVVVNIDDLKKTVQLSWKSLRCRLNFLETSSSTSQQPGSQRLTWSSKLTLNENLGFVLPRCILEFLAVHLNTNSRCSTVHCIFTVVEMASTSWHLRNWVGLCEVKVWVFAASLMLKMNFLFDRWALSDQYLSISRWLSLLSVALFFLSEELWNMNSCKKSFLPFATKPWFLNQ